MNTSRQYRQGDLLFIERGAPYRPSQYAQRITDGVVQRGEATGHAHRLVEVVDGVTAVVDQLWQDRGEMVAVLDRPTDLVHEEHATITLPEGTFTVRRQREFRAPDQVDYISD